MTFHHTLWSDTYGVPVAQIYENNDGTWTALMVYWRSSRSAPTLEALVRVAEGWAAGEKYEQFVVDFVHEKHEDPDPECPNCVVEWLDGQREAVSQR